MKIGIVSDTHGQADKLLKLVQEHPEIDYWLHAGDGASDCEVVRQKTKAEIFTVAGNCDGFSRLETRSFFTGSIQMHGNNLVLPMGMASVGAEVRLFQMNGKLVTTYKMAKGQNLLTFKVPPGLYFLKVI